MGDKWASIDVEGSNKRYVFFYEQTFWERLFGARGRWSHVFKRSGWLRLNGALGAIIYEVDNVDYVSTKQVERLRLTYQPFKQGPL